MVVANAIQIPQQLNNNKLKCINQTNLYSINF